MTRPIVLFHPDVPTHAHERVQATLATRWIGQGPRVDEFEQRFSNRFGAGRASVAVSSGTAALHLAYVLAGIEPGDEVVTPVFTCTATNIPLLYQHARPVFADIQPDTLNVDPDHVRTLVSERTRAIVCVHYGGLPCDMAALHAIAREWSIPVIEDAAHALGATYGGASIGTTSQYTTFSFQAIKHLTTGDGGLLMLDDLARSDEARRRRWFGIDRKASHAGTWENDITELGYKYQMTDIAASIGIAGLDTFDAVLQHRRQLLRAYEAELDGFDGIRVIGRGRHDREHAAWICTVLVENRSALERVLAAHDIESRQVHYRNDRYAIFGGRRDDLANMDAVEERYLVLPLHTHMDLEDVARICDVIRSGW